MKHQKFPSNIVSSFTLPTILADDYFITGNEQIFFYQLLPDCIYCSDDFDRIYKGTRKSDCLEVIIKILKIPKNGIQTKKFNLKTFIENRLAIVQKIKNKPHKNIMPYIYVGVDKEFKEVYEILEHTNAENIGVFDFEPEEIIELLYQVASAVSHLHHHGLIHHNINLNSILVYESNGKRIYMLTGFGLSILKHNSNSTHVNDWIYKAPELAEEGAYDQAIDIWSLGVVLYYLFFKSFPLESIDDGENKNKPAKNVFEYALQTINNEKIDFDIISLLKEMLETNPKKRIALSEVINNIEKMRTSKNFCKKSSQKNERIKPIENQSSSTQYFSIDNPIKLDFFKMDSGICFAGRGLVGTTHFECNTYFSLDHNGVIFKIDGDQNSVIAKKIIDTKLSSSGCCIVLNKSEKILLMSSFYTMDIYAIATLNMQILKEWKQTHIAFLRKIIFIDNETFCAGYSDGVIKIFKINHEADVSSFKISEHSITAFYNEENSKELLVGDSQGKFSSAYFDELNKKKWEVKYHTDQINSICKSGAITATGSWDKTIVLMISSKPPQIFKKIVTESYVCQIMLTSENKNLLVACWKKFLLFKHVNEEFEKTYERSCKTDFSSYGLQSFILLNNKNVIIGDDEGYIYSMTLAK